MPRCEILPETNHEVSFLIDGTERTRWHFGEQYPRPCFYPMVAPSGRSVTRMGHPGAPDHDHHQSVWFAHYKVLGINFWNNNSDAVVRQKQWLAYEDGDEEARMAVVLQWLDGHEPTPLMEQELIVAARATPANGFQLELQSRFIPTSETLELQKTNFGFLGIRVARYVSSVFGGGTVTNSAGQIGGRACHEQEATWVDYSGTPNGMADATEGITYVDHPANPGQNTRWHVRDDGWMCASPFQRAGLITRKNKPLEFRYLLDVHGGALDVQRANSLYEEFSSRPALSVRRSKRPHHHYEISR